MLIGCSGEKQGEAPALPPTTLARLYEQGREAYNAGKFDEAATHFAAVVQAEPLYLKAWINWGAALSRAGQGWEAIAKFQHVLQQDPRNAEAQYNWGAALARLNRHQEAVEHFEEAIAMKPTSEFLSPELQAKLQDYLYRQRQRVQESDAIKMPGVPPPSSPRSGSGSGR
jgi:tetratricopeptide (TPR) repeat protein